jgi:hypothetical protein
MFETVGIFEKKFPCLPEETPFIARRYVDVTDDVSVCSLRQAVLSGGVHVKPGLGASTGARATLDSGTDTSVSSSGTGSSDGDGGNDSDASSVSGDGSGGGGGDADPYPVGFANERCNGGCAGVFVAKVDDNGEAVRPIEVIRARGLDLGHRCVVDAFPAPSAEEAWCDYWFKNGREFHELDSRDKRAPTYNWYARQIYGVRGRHNRCRMAGCVLKYVRDLHPGGTWKGHQWF